MKSKLGLIVTLSLFLMLTAYSGYLSAGQPDISHAWKGSDSSRTWVVYEFDGEPPAESHFEIGDTFRIQGVRSNMQFIPLGVLRGRWSHIGASGIALTKKGPNKQKLCGEFPLNNHPNKPPHKPHFIQVTTDLNDENKIWITISDDANFECATASHGGRVHAEN